MNCEFGFDCYLSEESGSCKPIKRNTMIRVKGGIQFIVDKTYTLGEDLSITPGDTYVARSLSPGHVYIYHKDSDPGILRNMRHTYLLRQTAKIQRLVDETAAGLKRFDDVLKALPPSI